MTENKYVAVDGIVTPEGAVFRCPGLVRIATPHPYCIGSRHVVHASGKFGGMLGEAAIESAEKDGARCCVEGCHLSFRNHINQRVLLVVVPDDTGKDLNNVPGLGAWLTSIKPVLEKEGIDGIIIPKESQSGGFSY